MATSDTKAAAGGLGQQLLEVATTLRLSRLPSALQLVRGLHPVCSAGRDAAIDGVTELRPGYPGPSSTAVALETEPLRELPWTLLLSANHLRGIRVSWEWLQQLAAKQQKGQCLTTLFAPRLKQLAVGGKLLPNSGAHLAQLLHCADSLQTIHLTSPDGGAVLSFGTHQAPPVMK